MGVRFYDEALVKKLGKWIRDPNLTILKPDESTRFFEMQLDNYRNDATYAKETGKPEHRAKPDAALRLPLIAVSRDKNIEILNVEKQSKTFNGFRQAYKNADKETKIVVPLNVIPIQIGYQIDVYTKGIVEADEYIRNFIFNFINYPKLLVDIPYNDINIHHESIIHLESNISDNSDIREHLFADQFTRFTIKIMVDDAYLFSLPLKQAWEIDETGDLDIYNKEQKLEASETVTLA